MAEEKTIGISCRNCKIQTTSAIKVRWWNSSQELTLKLENSNFAFKKAYRDEGIDIVCNKCGKVICTLKYQEIAD